METLDIRGSGRGGIRVLGGPCRRLIVCIPRAIQFGGSRSGRDKGTKRDQGVGAYLGVVSNMSKSSGRVGKIKRRGRALAQRPKHHNKTD